ncbi:MAG: prephenate dehydrogenase/arogenate dehydrogenase family protein [Candidatus Omnitrophica bacterium]|nr:prephenate dehydrogenase/arogenate dehydrogenase family protein [Candidatus Omnitrophota bacterium]
MTLFKTIGITGLGLIGGSLALEIKKRNVAETVVGFSRRHSTLEKAKTQGLIDEYFTNFETGIKNLDLLIIATPVGVIKDYFLRIKKVSPSVLVTDVASVKEKIVNDAVKILGKDSNFVGSHPIAGSDKSGIEAAQRNLFEGKFVIITPCKYTKKENILKIKNFWETIGAKTILISPEEHDRLLALTSHLPHFIVYLLLSLLKENKDRDILLSCIGTGFLDTTRIGKSPPELWAEIFIANRKNLLKHLSEFEKNLSEMTKILKEGNIQKLTEKLISFKKVRDELDGKR